MPRWTLIQVASSVQVASKTLRLVIRWMRSTVSFLVLKSCCHRTTWIACRAIDLPVAPNNINNARVRLKRLTDRGILTETEEGLFTQS